jgi:large subunit ribosomal protein L5
MRERYKNDVMPALQKRFGYRTVMQVPKVEKVVINMRVADALQDQRHLDKAVEELTTISGQRPVIARARRSIAAFKLRTGNPIGCKVTLRGERMYEFLDKLFNISLPRIKDFKGIPSRSFDGRGSMNIGIREQLIFPEIEYDKVDKIRGMDIAIVTTARSDEEARELLRGLGLPFREGAAAEAPPAGDGQGAGAAPRSADRARPRRTAAAKAQGAPAAGSGGAATNGATPAEGA